MFAAWPPSERDLAHSWRRGVCPRRPDDSQRRLPVLVPQQRHPLRPVREQAKRRDRMRSVLKRGARAATLGRGRGRGRGRRARPGWWRARSGSLPTRQHSASHEQVSFCSFFGLASYKNASRLAHPSAPCCTRALHAHYYSWQRRAGTSVTIRCCPPATALERRPRRCPAAPRAPRGRRGPARAVSAWPTPAA